MSSPGQAAHFSDMLGTARSRFPRLVTPLQKSLCAKAMVRKSGPMSCGLLPAGLADLGIGLGVPIQCNWPTIDMQLVVEDIAIGRNSDNLLAWMNLQVPNALLLAKLRHQ